MIARLLICPSIETLRFNLKGFRTNHPDVLYFKTGEKLGIAESRKIKKHFSLKPYSAKGRTVIVEDAGIMTEEAQNALLKTIEELPKDAVFILGSVSEANLLPTILSRCQVIKVQSSKFPGLAPRSGAGKVKNNNEEIEKLLNATIEKRFEYVEKTKNREELLSALVTYFHQNILQFPDFAAKLLQAEKWRKQNVNIRAILEYLMLVMPSKIW